MGSRFPRPPQGGINALALGPVMKSPVLAVPSKQDPHLRMTGILKSLVTDKVRASPVDEISFKSRVSSREEKLPFAIALMARQGKKRLPSQIGEENF